MLLISSAEALVFFILVNTTCRLRDYNGQSSVLLQFFNLVYVTIPSFVQVLYRL